MNSSEILDTIWLILFVRHRKCKTVLAFGVTNLTTITVLFASESTPGRFPFFLAIEQVKNNIEQLIILCGRYELEHYQTVNKLLIVA